MDQFLSAHGGKITGTISVFDRLIIKGHLPLGYPQGMEQLLRREGKLFKDLKDFVLEQSDRVKERARQLAEESGRPYEYHNTKIQKDQRARGIAERDGIDEGLVCVFAAVEPCRSFRLAFGEGRPRIVPAKRKCLFLYVDRWDEKASLRSDSKNDRLDAEQLARVARMDSKLLYPIQHRERSARADLAIMRSRDALVTTRTRLVNHVHGVLKSFGHRGDRRGGLQGGGRPARARRRFSYPGGLQDTR